MRTTDPEPVAGRPILGERVAKAPPAPPELRLKPQPKGPYGIVTEDGKMHTTTLPEELKP